MGTMTHYVDHADVDTGVSKVRTFMATNDSTKTKMIETLNELKSTVRIDGRTITNQSDVVSKSIDVFTSNNNKCIDTLNHIVEMYFKAKDHSVSMIAGEREKI